MRKTFLGLVVAGVALTASSLMMGWVVAASALAAEAPKEGTAIEDPRLGHYADETKTQGFTLDRTREMARLRFDGSKEILILKMVPGPQGVTYFKDELDRTILRLMPYGGATVYDENGVEGDAFGRDKNAKPLEIEPHSVSYVKTRAKEVQDRLHTNSSLKLSLEFDPSLEALKAQEKSLRKSAAVAFASTSASEKALEAPAMAARSESAPAALQTEDVAEEAQELDVKDIKTAGTVADAIEVFNVAFKRLAKDDLAREVMAARLERVTFRSAAEKGVTLEDRTLVISYVAEAGLDGRPSSAEIENFLLENL